jgi:hypothetical protein
MVKRKRRTKAELEQLDYQIFSNLEMDHPQSVRHEFYCMTNPTLPLFVPKTDKGNGNGYGVVQRRLSKLRKENALPYSWITDMSRRGYFTNTFDNAADFIKKMASTYRGHIWRDAGVHVEVWCESRSIAGVILPVCEEYCVDLYPAGGFSSLTLTYDSAMSIHHKTSGGEIPAHILYIGDYDPAGVLIDQNIKQSIADHLGADFDFNFHRLGINPDQIEALNLPTKPRKPSDKRSPHIRETVEAEAMPAHLMRALLTEAIEQFLPAHQLAVTKVAEESEREYLNMMAEVMANQFNEQGT